MGCWGYVVISLAIKLGVLTGVLALLVAQSAGLGYDDSMLVAWVAGLNGALGAILIMARERRKRGV